LKLFSPFLYKEEPKVKDLNDSLFPCPRQPAFHSYDQHLVLVSGGQAVKPCETESFFAISYKEGPKGKHLNDSSLCPLLLVSGGLLPSLSMPGSIRGRRSSSAQVVVFGQDSLTLALNLLSSAQSNYLD